MSRSPNPLIRSHGKNFLKIFAENGHLNSSKAFGYLAPISEEFCDAEKPFKFLTCIFFYFTFFGGNIYYIEVNPKLLSIQIKHMSKTVSSNQILHFIQLMESGKFQKFDHGIENEKFYNSKKVESYDLRKVKAEIFLYCGYGDALVAVKVKF